MFDNLISADFFIQLSIENSHPERFDEYGFLLMGSIGSLNDFRDMLLAGDYFFTESAPAAPVVLIVVISALIISGLAAVYFVSKRRKHAVTKLNLRFACFYKKQK